LKRGGVTGYSFLRLIFEDVAKLGSFLAEAFSWAPAVTLGPHVASLGMRFYPGTMFPLKYQGQIFIAEHGSWNRSEKIGYRITLVS